MRLPIRAHSIVRRGMLGARLESAAMRVLPLSFNNQCPPLSLLPTGAKTTCCDDGDQCFQDTKVGDYWICKSAETGKFYPAHVCG